MVVSLVAQGAGCPAWSGPEVPHAAPGWPDVGPRSGPLDSLRLNSAAMTCGVSSLFQTRRGGAITVRAMVVSQNRAPGRPGRGHILGAHLGRVAVASQVLPVMAGQT